MQWRQAALMLIPVAGMSMLSVLFVVLWQAIGEQTTSINRLQQRLSDIEQTLQDNPSISTELLAQQLKQVQNNQRELEDRISRTAQQHRDALRLEENLLQRTPEPDPFEITPTAPLTQSP